MIRSPRRHALLAAIALTLPGAASALNVNPDGVGQVLLFPYYTVESGQSTLVTIVNHTEHVKALKVRVRESRNSRVLRDFNLYVGPFDAWTAAIFPGPNGAASLATGDRSCTVPAGVTGSFSNTAYSGANRDHPQAMTALDSLERTREGSIEVIEMGRLSNGTASTQLAEEATFIYQADGPLNCQALVAAWAPAGGWTASPSADIRVPTGGLYGTASIVDVNDGTMIAYDATALARFYTNDAVPGALHVAPGAPGASLAQADNGNGQVIVELPGDDEIAGRTETFATGLARPDAVSLALMRYGFYGEFNIEDGIAASSEWIISLPTRYAYADTSAATAVAPFTDAFNIDGKSCEIARHAIYDRESRETGIPDGSVPPCTPPPQPPPPIRDLCGGTFAVTFGQSAFGPASARSAVLGSRYGLNIDLHDVTGFEFQSGHARVCFDDNLTPFADNALTVASSGRVYEGLPAIGFAVIRGENTQARPGVLASYAGATRLRGFVRRTTPAPAAQSPEPTSPRR